MFLLGFLLIGLIVYYTAVDILESRKRRRRLKEIDADWQAALARANAILEAWDRS